MAEIAKYTIHRQRKKIFPYNVSKAQTFSITLSSTEMGDLETKALNPINVSLEGSQYTVI